MIGWTIELKQDADYWEEQVTVTDENGSPVVFSDAEITIHPDTDHEDVVWSVENEKLLIVSDGVFGFEVKMEVIAAYGWRSGNFCWSVTYTDGHVDGSWLTGRVVIKEACL
jgi:hypothetical protein